jgi:HK97 family phage portal protein
MILDLLRPKSAITTSSELYKAIRAATVQSDSGESVTVTSAMRTTAVYACVQVIAESLAQLPLILYERLDVGKKKADNTLLHYLLHDAPNEFQTSFEWRVTKTMHLLLYGSGYSFIVRSPTTGKVLELLPVHPNNIKPRQEKNYSIVYEYTDAEGRKQDVSSDKIFRVMGLSLDGFTGISPIEYHRQTIGTALATNKHSALNFKNGVRFSGVLEMPARLKDEDTAKRVRESFQDAFGGENSWGVPLLEDGMTWKSVSMNNKDLQYIEQKQFNVEDIARIFRVPLHKIQHLLRATNNNIEHQGLEFVVDTMMPHFKRWEQSITRDLLTSEEKKKYFAEFLVDGLMRGDAKSRAEFYNKAVGRPWMSGNEARIKENMNPIDGLDDVVLPLNMDGGKEDDINSQE